MKSELEREIENLIDAGYHVLPISQNEKRPACSNGVKDATNDKDEATRLFTNVNPLNVGIACDNLFVLDVDVKNGGNGLEDLFAMEAALGALPPAPCVETPSGGRHYYFKKPTGRVKATTRIEFAGYKTSIDIRTGSTYVLAPPSKIDGKRYERAGELIAVDDLPELPAAWLGIFKEANAPPTKTKTTNAQSTERYPAALVPTTNDEIESAVCRCRKYIEKIDSAIEGQCGGKTFFQVCNVIFNGFALSEEDGRPLLEEYNARCLPPWNLDDAQDRRYFESSIKKAIETPQRERGELFAKTNGLDGDELDATFNNLVAEINRKLGKTTKTTDDKNAAKTNLKENDAGGKNDADDRDDDGFLSLERQKERRKEERERRERMRQIWAAKQYRAPFPTEAVPEIVRRRIEYAQRTLNAEPSGLFAAATAAASSTVGYAAKVKRDAKTSIYLMLPCTIVGPTGAGKSPLVNVMAAPYIEFAKKVQAESALNRERWRNDFNRKAEDYRAALAYYATSLTPEAMKADVAGLRNSQYETRVMSTLLFFNEEATDVISGGGYNNQSAARQNAAYIAAFDGAPLSELRVSTGDRNADAILMSAIFGVQPKPLANGFKKNPEFLTQGATGRFLWDEINANPLPRPSFRSTAEDDEAEKGYWGAFEKLRGLFLLSRETQRREREGLTVDDDAGYSFNNMPGGEFLTPQYLDAPYVFELNDDAIRVFGDYTDEVNGKARPEYNPGGDEIAGAYWRKSTDKVLQLAAHLRLFDWAAKKPGAFTETGEPNIRLDADVLRRSIDLNIWYAENYVRIMNDVRNIDGAEPPTKGDGTNAKLNETIIAQVEKLYRKNGGTPVKLSMIQKYASELRKIGKGANKILKEHLLCLTNRGEVFGNLKDGFFPAFDDATDDDGDEDDAN